MKIKLNKRKIKRNILIVIFLILAIKYMQFINNYNKEVFADYQEFVSYSKNNNLSVSKDNYKNYINNN